MRVGYFGGSFDPPHRGHLRVARAARDAFALDTVLLAPTGRQPLKPGGASAGYADRLAMTALLCEGERGLEASGVDAPRPEHQSNYTADTLQRLRAELPKGTTVFAIVGADAFLGVPQWHEADTLFALAEWIVVSRPGIPEHQVRALPLRAAAWARVHWLNGVEDPASATELRGQMRAGQLGSNAVPERVLRFVRERHLYGM